MAAAPSGRSRGWGWGWLRGSLLQKAGDGLGGLRPARDPVLGAVDVDLDGIALLEGRISADFLDEPAVAWTAAIRHHDSVNRVILRADPLEPYSDHNFKGFQRHHPGGAQVSSGNSGKRAWKLDKVPSLGKPLFGFQSGPVVLSSVRLPVGHPGGRSGPGGNWFAMRPARGQAREFAKSDEVPYIGSHKTQE